MNKIWQRKPRQLLEGFEEEVKTSTGAHLLDSMSETLQHHPGVHEHGATRRQILVS